MTFNDLTEWREARPDTFAAELRQAVASARPIEDDYWEQQKTKLSGEMLHVNFAEFVADQCAAGLRHVPNVGWIKWDGRIWVETGDDTAPMQAITDASRILMQRAATVPADTAWAGAAASKMLIHWQRIAIAREMAVLPQLLCDVDALDAQRHLLTFPNGTVDLRSGEIREHRATDMLTQCALVPYRPDVATPRWLQFVEEIFPGQDDLQRYYQTFLGYAMTGEVREHVLGVWYGAHGRNGKGATIRTLQAIFGSELVKEVPFTTWELTRGQQPHHELIASLRRARVVVSQEGNQGVPMDVARLKNYSGGDRISARHNYGKQFDFAPKFTMILATNHLPEFSAGGAALWARTKAILFGECFADRRDPDLEPTVQGPEAPGIAAWLVAGAVRYYSEGLRDPLAVIAATEQHKEEVDPLKPLVGELYEYDKDSEVARSTFNSELKEWRDVNGERSNKFVPQTVKRHLLDTGTVQETKSHGTWVYRGIYLMSAPPASKPGAGIFDRTSD